MGRGHLTGCHSFRLALSSVQWDYPPNPTGLLKGALATKGCFGGKQWCLQWGWGCWGGACVCFGENSVLSVHGGLWPARSMPNYLDTRWPVHMCPGGQPVG
jgi:hypothetical protein